jgi:hypothetical protein
MNAPHAMLNLDPIAYELLDTVLQTVEKHPDLAARLRAALGVDRLPEPAEAKLLTVREYAEHAGYCSRHVENLIREGMPLLGKGRARRGCVREADEWLRGHRPTQERPSPIEATRSVS